VTREPLAVLTTVSREARNRPSIGVSLPSREVDEARSIVEGKPMPTADAIRVSGYSVVNLRVCFLGQIREDFIDEYPGYDLEEVPIK